MPMGRLLALAAAGVVIGAPALASAQLLRSASDAVRGGGGSSSSSSSGQDDSSGSSSGGGLLGSASDAVRGGGGSSSRGSSSSGGYGFGGAAAYGGLAPVGGCPIGSPYLHHWKEGVLAPEYTEVRAAARLDVELGYAIGGAARVGFAARAQMPLSIDLATRYSIFLEPTDAGLVTVALGRFGMEIRILDDRYFQLRVGAGLRHFHDQLDGVFGGDVTLGFDVFPVEPLVVSADLSAGVVGQAVVVQARGELGVLFDRVEIYAGYDYEALFTGGLQVDLGGPMLGVRAWL